MHEGESVKKVLNLNLNAAVNTCEHTILHRDPLHNFFVFPKAFDNLYGMDVSGRINKGMGLCSAFNS